MNGHQNWDPETGERLCDKPFLSRADRGRRTRHDRPFRGHEHQIPDEERVGLVGPSPLDVGNRDTVGAVGLSKSIVLLARHLRQYVSTHLGRVKVNDAVEFLTWSSKQDGAKRAALGGDAPVAPCARQIVAKNGRPFRPLGATIGCR